MLFHDLVYLLPGIAALAPAFAAPAPVEAGLATVAARDTCVPGKHYVSIRPLSWTKVSSLYSPNQADHYDVRGGTGTAVRPLFFDPAVGYTMERFNLATYTPKVPGITWEETLEVWDSSTPYADTIYDCHIYADHGVEPACVEIEVFHAGADGAVITPSRDGITTECHVVKKPKRPE